MDYVVTVDDVEVGLVRLRFFTPASTPAIVRAWGGLRAGPGAAILRRHVPPPPPFAPFRITGRSSALPHVPAVSCTLLGADGSALGGTAVLERVGRHSPEVDAFLVHATWHDAPAGIRALVEPVPGIAPEHADEPNPFAGPDA